jgi:CRISPR-associated endonuclease Csy4
MDHYIEIRLLADPEFSNAVLMNALFAKLHRALVETGQGELGISFPNAGTSLGDRLRIHGKQAALTRLMSLPWLKGLRDYTETSPLLTVPDGCQHRVVQRRQAKSSAERLRRRSIAKGWLTEPQAIERIPDSKEQRIKAPFIQLNSASSGQTFRLFIHQDKPQPEPQPGVFSAYGLSRQATIPWF